MEIRRATNLAANKIVQPPCFPALICVSAPSRKAPHNVLRVDQCGSSAMIRNRSPRASALNAPGPIVVSKLPRGSYMVQASYAGKAQTRKISLGQRLHTQYLRWPSDPETDFPGPKQNEQAASALCCRNREQRRAHYHRRAARFCRGGTPLGRIDLKKSAVCKKSPSALPILQRRRLQYGSTDLQNGHRRAMHLR
jgi:hypothetical protein